MTEENLNFIEFIQTGARFTPAISILTSGTIGLTSGFVKKFDLNAETASAVKFFFEPSRMIIGMQFFKTKEEGMIAVKYIPNGGAQIKARAFLEKFDIKYKLVTNKYLPVKSEKLDPNGFLVYLTDPISTKSNLPF